MEEERVAVGGEDEGDVESLAVLKPLLHPSADGVVVVLRFDKGYGDVRLVVEDVVGALGLASDDELSANDDAAFREADLLANLRHHVPARLFDGRCDELRADIAFAEVLLVHDAGRTRRRASRRRCPTGAPSF